MAYLFFFCNFKCFNLIILPDKLRKILRPKFDLDFRINILSDKESFEYLLRDLEGKVNFFLSNYSLKYNFIITVHLNFTKLRYMLFIKVHYGGFKC